MTNAVLKPIRSFAASYNSTTTYTHITELQIYFHLHPALSCVMTSKALSQGNFLNPNSLLVAPKDEKISSYKHPTVYDAVAGTMLCLYGSMDFADDNSGRVSVAGFIPAQSIVPSTRDTASSSSSAVPPETVLYRSRNAPPRYAESDIYFANERRSVTNLPESDLLKSLHSYASDFYSRSCLDEGLDDWGSLDGTALIALGILLEESSLEVLGETGDLVFTEGEEVVDRTDSSRSKSRERPYKKRRLDVTKNK